MLSLVIVNTPEFQNKAALLHHLLRSEVIGKADTRHFGQSDPVHDDRQKRFDGFRGVTVLGVFGADMISDLLNAVAERNRLHITDVRSVL